MLMKALLFLKSISTVMKPELMICKS